MNVVALNAMSPADARAALLRCCGSSRWTDAMLARRPFASEIEMFAAADQIWARLDRVDWLEAFAAHPRIGDMKSLKEKYAPTAAWSAAEQDGVVGAADDILHELAEGNREYEGRFGHIFIVCATGKSAPEMLRLLRERLWNSAADELAAAAAEQAQITRLRLEKL